MTTASACALEARGLTEDAFLGDQLMVLQPARGYRAGLDAVLLAAAAPLPAGAGPFSVLDVGAGVGVVGLCLARRVPQAQVTLVERDPSLAALARENAGRNGLADRVTVMEADVLAPLGEAPDLRARAESFDVVLSNPPYHDAEAGTPAADPQKAGSHAMPAGALERWLRFMASMTKPGGTIALVHRADALGDLLEASRRRFGALRIQPLHPREGAPANRVIVSGVRGSRAPLSLCAGLVLHAEEGGFTPRVEAALRHGAALV
jgi:tRNA1(Val) A37 N6-methylase TrmN6